MKKSAVKKSAGRPKPKRLLRRRKVYLTREHKYVILTGRTFKQLQKAAADLLSQETTEQTLLVRINIEPCGGMVVRGRTVAEAFRVAVERAADSPDTLTLFAELVSSFQSDVLPLVDASPRVRLAVAAADVDLRVVARRVQREAGKVAAERPDVARSPRAAGAISTIDEYLKTSEVNQH